MNKSINEVKKKTFQYWTIDGVPDLYIGFCLILYTILTMLYTKFGFSLILIFRNISLLFLIAFGRIIIDKIKFYFTYPRTGYVVYKKPTPKELSLRILYSFFVAILLILIVIFILSTRGIEGLKKFYTILLPFFFAIFLLIISYSQKNIRYLIYAIIGVISGLYIIPVEVMFAITGISMIIGGLITLIRYLNKYSVNER